MKNRYKKDRLLSDDPKQMSLFGEATALAEEVYASNSERQRVESKFRDAIPTLSSCMNRENESITTARGGGLYLLHLEGALILR